MKPLNYTFHPGTCLPLYSTSVRQTARPLACDIKTIRKSLPRFISLISQKRVLYKTANEVEERFDAAADSSNQSTKY